MPASFYVVTNGSVNQKELALFLLETYPEMDDQEMCGLTVSSDIFHGERTRSETGIFSGLSFFRPEDKKRSLTETNFDWVLNTGLAELNGIGERHGYVSAEKLEDIIDCQDSGNTYIDELYVSANGNMVSNCDLSYEDIDRQSFGNVRNLQSLLPGLQVA